MKPTSFYNKAKDDLNGGFGKRKLGNNSASKHPWRGRRGSKTAEEMELNLPDNKRISMVEDFETDDDQRKRRLREIEQQKNGYEEDEKSQ